MTRFLGGKLDRVRASPLGGRLARGAVWGTVGVTASRVSLLVALMVVARIIGKDDFGALGVIQSTVGMLQIFAGLGMGLTATKYVAQHRNSDPVRTGRIIVFSTSVAAAMGAIMTLALYCASPWLARTVLGAPMLADQLRAGSGLLLFGSLLGSLTGAVMGLEGFRSMAAANAMAGIVSAVTIVAAAVAGGVLGAVWGLVGAAAVSCVFVGRAVLVEVRRARVPLCLSLRGSEWGLLGTFSLPALLAGIAVAPVNWVCSAILVRQPGGFAEMGVYSAANQWRTAVLHLPLVLGQVLTPMLAERVGADDHRGLRKLLGLALKTNLALALPVVVGLVALSHQIMRLYGPGFETGALTFAILMSTALLMAIQTPIGNCIAALGRMWVAFLMNLGWGIVAIVLTIAAIDHGALGLALAQLGAYLVHSIWTFLFAAKVLGRNGDLPPTDARLQGEAS